MPSSRRQGKTPTKQELQDQVTSMQAKINSLCDGGALSVPVEPALSNSMAHNASSKAGTNVVYTDEMVRTLLELRWSFFRARIQQCTSHAQRSVLWEKLTLKFNILVDKKIGSLSLKNKMHNLRREYVRTKTSFEKTGNDTDISISLPSYWDDLVQYFGDKKGLGDLEFGDEVGSALESDHESSEDSESSTENKTRKRQIQEVIKQQRKQREPRKQNKNDVANGLVSLGNTLAKGLVDAASMSANNDDVIKPLHNMIEETNKQLASIATLLVETKQTQDKANNVQEQLLQFMKDKLQ
ncbi:hypothetical protein LEN26_016399 [Aphanomyces euteiches]|nr:hypothetical protein LEN26_016399 [Aphanomyces euteiches]